MSCLDVSLSSFRFEGDARHLRRDRIGTPEERSEGYDSRYDFSTLFYDVYYDDRVGEIRIVCPTLMNFQSLVEQTCFFIDGEEVDLLGIESLSRGAVLRLPCEIPDPKVLRLKHDDFGGEVPIGRLHLDHFAGKNVLFAISKDNRLEWIEDWLRYYVKVHGANAVLIFDNESSIYEMDALRKAIAGVQGIETAAVVRAWFPFGPGGSGNVNFNSKFLHMTMVELGRQRFLFDARAVLNVDIDEFVYSRSGRSVFDATVDNPEGYLRFNGEWVYPKTPLKGEFPRHLDHGFTRKDGRPKVSRKWSIVPNGPLRDRLWRTHRIKSRKDPVTDEFGFWHFRKISTNWDYARDEPWLDAEMQADQRLQRAMSDVFRDKPEPQMTIGRKLLITAMKNEAPYILEWVAYHRAIGFDDILVYSNDCSDGTVELLDRLQELGVLVHERNVVLRRGPQKSALKAAKSHPLTAGADWIYVADIDEFLNIKIGDGQVDTLIKALPGADVIPVTWKLFSNDKRDRIEDEFVISQFCESELDLEDGGLQNRFVKSLFRVNSDVERFGTHGPVVPSDCLGNFSWVQPDGRVLNETDNLTRPAVKYAYEIAQINHYAVKAVDAYLVKKERGRVNHVNHVMGLKYWKKMCRGGARDQTILRHLDKVRAVVDALLTDHRVKALHHSGVEWHQQRAMDLLEIPEFQALKEDIQALEPVTASKDKIVLENCLDSIRAIWGGMDEKDRTQLIERLERVSQAKLSA